MALSWITVIVPGPSDTDTKKVQADVKRKLGFSSVIKTAWVANFVLCGLTRLISSCRWTGSEDSLFEHLDVSDRRTK